MRVLRRARDQDWRRRVTRRSCALAIGLLCLAAPLRAVSQGRLECDQATRLIIGKVSTLAERFHAFASLKTFPNFLYFIAVEEGFANALREHRPNCFRIREVFDARGTALTPSNGEGLDEFYTSYFSKGNSFMDGFSIDNDVTAVVMWYPPEGDQLRKPRSKIRLMIYDLRQHSFHGAWIEIDKEEHALDPEVTETRIVEHMRVLIAEIFDLLAQRRSE